MSHFDIVYAECPGILEFTLFCDSPDKNTPYIVKNTFGCAISFIFSSNVIDKT